MDYAKSFTFVFEDKDVLSKLGFASLYTFIGLLLLVVPGSLYMIGYALETGKNVYRGEKNPLPDPGDIGTHFGTGFKYFLVSLGYLFPIIVLIGIQALLFGGLAIAADEGGGDAAGAVFAFVGIFFTLFYIVFGFALAILLQAVPAQFIRTDGDIAACFNFGEIISITRNNIIGLILIIACAIGASLAGQVALYLSALTICGPLLLFMPITVWTQLVTGHLWGQLALEIDAPKDSAAPLAPA